MMQNLFASGFTLRARIVVISLMFCFFTLAGKVQSDDLEADPIRYSQTTPHNRVSQLQKAIDTGQIQLRFDQQWGYLRSVLDALHVPVDSQMLVYSKTSLQRHRIAPRSPRAVYFNDEVYIGYCQKGDVMELAAVDPLLGTVFYTLDQQPQKKPLFRRQWDSCLICHGSSAMQGYPGHLVRSVYSDTEGQPILSTASYRTDQTSPFKHRWGGWYVTGSSGKQWHMGNLIIQDKRRVEQIELSTGSNLKQLNNFFDVAAYPTPHSDIVALMVFEHQSEMHNRLTRANLQTRQALYTEAELRRELKLPPNHVFESTRSRLRAQGEPLVKYMFFAKETPLTEPIVGTSRFTHTFSLQGARDQKGRSLKDLDLKQRLFKYPCSYLIYSDAFDALPESMLDYIYSRMVEILSGKDSSSEFAHLSAMDRRNILEILLATKRTIPPHWHKALSTTLEQLANQ